jgi:hypothetical protein
MIPHKSSKEIKEQQQMNKISSFSSLVVIDDICGL